MRDHSADARLGRPRTRETANAHEVIRGRTHPASDPILDVRVLTGQFRAEGLTLRLQRRAREPAHATVELVQVDAQQGVVIAHGHGAVQHEPPQSVQGRACAVALEGLNCRVDQPPTVNDEQQSACCMVDARGARDVDELEARVDERGILAVGGVVDVNEHLATRGERLDHCRAANPLDNQPVARGEAGVHEDGGPQVENDRKGLRARWRAARQGCELRIQTRGQRESGGAGRRTGGRSARWCAHSFSDEITDSVPAAKRLEDSRAGGRGAVRAPLVPPLVVRAQLDR